jgi:hypothetical protein
MIKAKVKKLLSRKIAEKIQTCGNYFFIHIPKTAGTSFRSALEEEFEIIKDYGNHSNNTSAVIQCNSYDNNDLFLLKQHLWDKNNFCITGHTHLVKYVDFVPIENTITFVREPIEQLLSHYNHYVSYHGFEEGLDEFLDKPFAKNFQSKFIQAIPLGLIGYVGLTEQYDECLALINKQYSLSIKPRKVNVSENKQYTPTTLESVLTEKFLKNNKQDVAMYEEAKFLHAQRLGLNDRNKTWVYSTASINTDNVLHGCAYYSSKGESVSVVVKINGEKFKTIVAKHFYGAYVRANFPRKRYVALHLVLPKSLTTTDDIDLYVEGTGQKLNFEPLRVSN